MKRIMLTFLLTLGLAIGALAQEKPKTDPPAATPEAKANAAMPTIDEILDRQIKSLGGKEALEKITSRVVKGNFEIEGMNITGTFENYAKAPNKTSNNVDISGVGAFVQIFDGEKAWSSDPMNGQREITGNELASTRREAEFYRELNLKKLFPKMELKGKETVGTAEAYVVIATPEGGGDPEKFYFDATSFLLIRHDADRDSPQGKIGMETYFSDFKAVDGVKMAHQVRQVSPAFSLSLKFTEVKHNVEIDNAKFNKPAAP